MLAGDRDGYRRHAGVMRRRPVASSNGRTAGLPIRPRPVRAASASTPPASCIPRIGSNGWPSVPRREGLDRGNRTADPPRRSKPPPSVDPSLARPPFKSRHSRNSRRLAIPTAEATRPRAPSIPISNGEEIPLALPWSAPPSWLTRQTGEPSRSRQGKGRFTSGMSTRNEKSGNFTVTPTQSPNWPGPPTAARWPPRVAMRP
jgi:hypothetical protein